MEGNVRNVFYSWFSLNVTYIFDQSGELRVRVIAFTMNQALPSDTT